MRVWLLALLIKTVISTWLPLSNDEAYYWVWGNFPQLSYFDHPPMVGWIFWIGTWIDFVGNSVRLPGVWLGHLTLLLWHRILQPHLSNESSQLWLGFVLLSPFLGLGSLIITPDVPMLFFWTLSLLILLKLLEKPRLTLYAALGATLGLGFCSKYLIVLFVPIALLWLAWSGNWRKIHWAYLPIPVLTGLIFCAPVIYWNWQNEWASFRFQIDHGLVSEKPSLAWPFEYLLGQLILLFPPIAWLATRRREPKSASFLHFFGWLPLAFFFYTSFKAPVEANWPFMGHPALLSLAFLNIQSLRDWRWMKLTVSVWIILTLLIFSEIASPWIPVPERHKKTSEFTRYEILVDEARGKDNFFVGSYQMAGHVSYKLRRQVFKLSGMNRRDFYDFMSQSTPSSDTFFVGAEIGHALPKWVTEKGYEVKSTRRLNDQLHVLEVKRRAQDSDQ